jgi:hypothetical protein
MVVEVSLRVSERCGDDGRTEEDPAQLHAELSELDVRRGPYWVYLAGQATANVSSRPGRLQILTLMPMRGG